MKTEPATVGTSLEVLAPYLPYGIDVKWKHGQARYYELTGLVTQTSTCYLEGKYSAFAEDLLPVLCPFTALGVALPNGKVPAIEAFKALLAHEEIGWDRAKVNLEEPAPNRRPGYKQIRVWAPLVGEVSAGFWLWLDSEWRVLNGQEFSEHLYLKELIKQHAAVGLEPHQFIEKPAPAPTPIQEGRESQGG